MASKAHQSAHQCVDADRVVRGKDEKTGQPPAAAIAGSLGWIAATLTVDRVIEKRKQSAERLDGYAQAA
jgi:hypothetical protein